MDDTLHKVKDIKTLEIQEINASHHEVLSLNLPQFSRLKILSLQGSSIPWTALTLSGLPQLRTLVLSGPIKRTCPEEVRAEDIPGSLRGLSCLELNYGWPASLTYLRLVNSHVHRDPLPFLGQLSELRFLSLIFIGFNWGKEMKFRGDEFKQLQKLTLQYTTTRIIVEDGAMPRLQKLRLSYNHKLKRMTVEDGAMPPVQKLKISNCKKLERMTVEDGAMPRLQKLEICECPRLKTIPRRLEDLVEWKDQLDFEMECSF